MAVNPRHQVKQRLETIGNPGWRNWPEAKIKTVRAR